MHGGTPVDWRKANREALCQAGWSVTVCAGTERGIFEHYGLDLAKNVKLVNLEVGDVPEKELPRLTERFYRVDRARSKSTDIGHGLGLAIVKELLEKYGGSLEISNHEQYGLSVAINLPVIK